MANAVRGTQYRRTVTSSTCQVAPGMPPVVAVLFYIVRTSRSICERLGMAVVVALVVVDVRGRRAWMGLGVWAVRVGCLVGRGRAPQQVLAVARAAADEGTADVVVPQAAGG